MEVDPTPDVTFAGMDARLLISCVESIAGTDPLPHLRAPPAPHMTMQHHLPVDEPFTGHVSPLVLGTRRMTPLELAHNYAMGNFDAIDIPRSHDVESTSNTVPVEQRCALRLVQALTIATNFDHTFSLQQLSSRDLCMIDAFLRDDFLASLRDMLVEDATLPTPSQILYPSLKHLPIVAIVQSFQGIQQAATNLAQYSADITATSASWNTAVDLINTIERISVLEANVNTHRHIIDKHIIAAMNTTQDQITTFVDLLHQFALSLVRLEHLQQAATAACAEAHLIQENLFKRLRTHFSAKKPLQEPDAPTTEETSSREQWAPVTEIPSQLTTTTTTTPPSTRSKSVTQSTAAKTTSAAASTSTATVPRTTTSSISVTRSSSTSTTTLHDQPKRARLSRQSSTSSRGSTHSPSRAPTSTRHTTTTS
ncbi:hypothetical protein ANCCEY_14737 [Ancylostoma ceylanicum]|uniref:Uncharacterized protein n=1 Tax=Ancylostoma ceylanicum TaxID=53326 RepID=A0A0D6LET8_9BILA|nr:hypothetical protein ANCCEY_14737 [Ancylostoma ceylanicum]